MLRTIALALVLSTAVYAQTSQPSIDVNKAFDVLRKQRDAANDAAAKAEMEKIFIMDQMSRVQAELDALKKPDEPKK